ncbi:LVIVD repeat-containing protein [Flavilitoribacter nigricans]|uniref:LVIVD repeat-containing protein n=1 Tax=Flavilitoribacter nigricans (strain ATCC 23147 / DSM 23189 / NBRC 102662 / NCIMB 1420 / SS-2) TaxID=1122177 RepID=A0A2D0NE05_FLAN2|nr:hypothetical protein [Flavilitoribacter nigricans]PHN06610.1 hypothetical protein CRP01_09930 [Flavilitoribacter nigricans DSM 23189 = NBRC 102662]
MPKHTLFFTLLVSALFFQSCQKDGAEMVSKEYRLYKPVYLDMEDYRPTSGILASNPEIDRPDRMLTYGNYLFISDRRAGIHIVDNADPVNPQLVNFIQMPGIDELCIRENYLYVGDFADLVVFDISNPANPELLQRSPYFFSDLEGLTARGVLIDFELEERKITVNVDDPNYQNDIFWIESEQAYAVEQSLREVGGRFTARDGLEFLDITPNPISSDRVRNQYKFSLYGDNFYLVKNERLQVYNFNNGLIPVASYSLDDCREVRSVRAFENYLLVYGERGLFVMDTRNPGVPQLIELFGSYNPCLPSFFTGNYGYIGVRTGACGRYTSSKGVYVHDFSEKEPVLWQVLNAESPWDIEVVNEQTLVADWTSGLKVFSKPERPEPIERSAESIIDIRAFYIEHIPGSNIAVIGAIDGIYQYDFSKPGEPELLSVLPVK